MQEVFSVTQINTYIKNLFARDYALQRVTVAGEVSNCKIHPSGHIYFTLKDEGGALSCVMFQRERQGLSFLLADGQQVEVRGQISVYEKTGAYQLYAREIRLSGAGELYERFLRLKEELAEMGMFDPMYKKPIPKYAKKIGIVTAETGAAIRDIVNVSKRRNPTVELTLCPALVQGQYAAASLAAAIRRIDKAGMDVLIVGRGGGSIEDLWPFNEEIVARAIFDCVTPVISAVGHETDFTIADFVADLRAPTPSAAAELANFDLGVFYEETAGYEGQLSRFMMHKLSECKARVSACEASLVKKSPEAELGRLRERTVTLEKTMNGILLRRLSERKLSADAFSARLGREMEGILSRTKERFGAYSGKLEAMSPLKKLSGGYGYVTSGGNAVKSAGDVKSGDSLLTYFGDGKVRSVVTEVEK